MLPAAKLILPCVAAGFGVARFLIPTHALSPVGSYEAFAHLFVGGLLGAWLATRERPYLVIALALTAVEVLAFFTLPRG